jgi:hypothetical protein
MLSPEHEMGYVDHEALLRQVIEAYDAYLADPGSMGALDRFHRAIANAKAEMA